MTKINYFRTDEQERKVDKAIQNVAKDFTFEEVVVLFQVYGFTLENKDATSGSRIKFYNMVSR